MFKWVNKVQLSTELERIQQKFPKILQEKILSHTRKIELKEGAKVVHRKVEESHFNYKTQWIDNQKFIGSRALKKSSQKNR